MRAISLQKFQRRVFILCWCAYAGAYLCRSNLSIALPGMMSDQGWSKIDVGLFGTAFFWAYAIGQLINGTIGDKVKSRPFIFVGLCVSSLANLAVGFSSNTYTIIFLWCINGFFLSTLWGPIVKTMSLWYTPQERAKKAVILSCSMIGGYFLAWGVVGQIIVHLSWRWAFWIPAAIVFAFSLVWLAKMRNCPEEVGLNRVDESLGTSVEKMEQDVDASKISFVKVIVDTRLWLVALTCIAQGIVKDGIALWAPTFLGDTHKLGQSAVSLFSLAIPLMSLFGILGAGWLNSKYPGNERKSVIILISAAAVSSLLLYLFFHANAIITITLLSLTIALMYGANTILLTFIPLKYEKYGKVSSAVGFLDFTAYLGAAAAGILIGLISDRIGWNYVVLSWVVISVLGVVFMSACKNEKREKIEEKEVQTV